MPRHARLDAPGVLQHVMARGIERRKIFWDDKDRASFLERLALILEKTQTQCYAWALIPNHFHKSLDKYPWSGHSVLIGKQKNPLVPEIPLADEKDKYLAEKTVEDVLQYFGKNLKEARRRYRVFVEKGIKHGRREDLQGGGLVRSAGGDKRGLLGRKKGEREKGDQRILGSGDFVANVIKDANEVLDQTAKFDIPLDELISRVCAKLEIRVKDLMSKSRKRCLSQARGVVCYLAVDELGYRGDDVARSLRISGRGVSDCRERGRKILDKPEIIGEYLV